ncbi:MAG: hypothetical protein ACYTGZ_03565 [Planctomycetota bacterium]|jgi:hypothetical protein
MSTLDIILPVFLVRLVGGYAICLGLFGPRVNEGSWRKVSLFVIAALCGVAAYMGAPLWPCLVTGIVALLVERAVVFELPYASDVRVMLPLGLWMLLASEWPPGFATFPSAIAVGGALGAMLLGHSYLTAPNLSFRPFQRFTLLLFGILLVRTLTMAPVFFADNLVMMDWVYLSARVAFGIFLPLVFGWMAWQCAKIESNQSATGILYATTALIFLGELTAIFLHETRGIIT